MIAFTAGLAVLAAAIVGVSRHSEPRDARFTAAFQQVSSRASPMQLGRVWTTFIVVQVAVAVWVLPYAIHSAGR